MTSKLNRVKNIFEIFTMIDWDKIKNLHLTLEISDGLIRKIGTKEWREDKKGGGGYWDLAKEIAVRYGRAPYEDVDKIYKYIKYTVRNV